MKILITGASGLVGTALMPKLKDDGHHLLTLVRKTPKDANEVEWNPLKEVKDISKLEGVDAVVHLAGDNVAEGRWTVEKKKSIRDSRVIGTKVLCEALLKIETPPKVFISASAIGIYGNCGNEILTEESSFGDDFLAKVCVEWEKASYSLKEKNIRTVYARIGIILSKHGGALEKMLTPAKLGLGGKLGSGKQYMSWVSIEDTINAIDFLLKNENLSDAFNITAPNPVTNEEFTKTLGKVLSRPTFFTAPEFALKLAFGELAEVALLASQRVMPEKLQKSGFQFKHPILETALMKLLA